MAPKAAIQVPDGFGNPVLYDLTVSYPDDQQLEETETRDGVCVKPGVVRRREEPVFCWVRLGPEPGLVPADSTLRQQIEDDLRINVADHFDQTTVDYIDSGSGAPQNGTITLPSQNP